MFFQFEQVKGSQGPDLLIINESKVEISCQQTQFTGQVDSPESPGTPEITEMTENFTKVTEYLTRLKDTLINYVQEKSHVIKQ